MQQTSWWYLNNEKASYRGWIMGIMSLIRGNSRQLQGSEFRIVGLKRLCLPTLTSINKGHSIIKSINKGHSICLGCPHTPIWVESHWALSALRAPTPFVDK